MSLLEEINFQDGAQHSGEFNSPCPFVRFTFATPGHCGYPTPVKTPKLSKECEYECVLCFPEKFHTVK